MVEFKAGKTVKVVTLTNYMFELGLRHGKIYTIKRILLACNGEKVLNLYGFQYLDFPASRFVPINSSKPKKQKTLTW